MKIEKCDHDWIIERHMIMFRPYHPVVHLRCLKCGVDFADIGFDEGEEVLNHINRCLSIVQLLRDAK